MAAKLARNILRTGFKSRLFREHGMSTPKFSPYVISRSIQSETRSGLVYSKEHEWLIQEGDTAKVGITNYAQDLLGDVVYCELPEVGTELEQGDSCGTIESVKAVSDIFTPVGGEVIEVNTILTDEPGFINKKPYDDGWLFKLKVKNADEIKELMSEDDYKQFLETLD